MLEGEAYWGRIRTMKRQLYLIEGGLTVVIGAIIIFFAGDYQSSPFFMAIDRLVWFILLMLFVIMVESFLFRLMQLRIAKSDSTKHIMTINSMKKALVILIAAAVFGILFAAPSTSQAMEDALSFQGELRADNTRIFLSGDPMGFSKIESIYMTSETGAEVLLLTQDHYEQHIGDWSFLRAVALNTHRLVDPDLDIELQNIGHMYLYLIIDSDRSVEGAQVDFVLQREFNETLTVFIPGICLAFAVASIAWLAYLIPLRKKFSTGSIYK